MDQHRPDKSGNTQRKWKIIEIGVRRILGVSQLHSTGLCNLVFEEPNHVLPWTRPSPFDNPRLFIDFTDAICRKYWLWIELFNSLNGVNLVLDRVLPYVEPLSFGSQPRDLDACFTALQMLLCK
jgi:hypothetical protein